MSLSDTMHRHTHTTQQNYGVLVYIPATVALKRNTTDTFFKMLFNISNGVI